MLKLEDIESGCELEFVSYYHKVKYSKLATYNKSLIRKCISDNGTFTVAGGSSKDSVKVKCCNRASILSESMEIDLDELQFFKLAEEKECLKLKDLKKDDEIEFTDDDRQAEFIESAPFNKIIVERCMSKFGTFKITGLAGDLVKVKSNSGASSENILHCELQYFKLAAKDAPSQSPKRHKNADMIIAKANDVSLVLLFRPDDVKVDKWAVSQSPAPFSGQPLEYYLCHPKHVEACLHWLNGGEIKGGTLPYKLGLNEGDVRWCDSDIFMTKRYDIEIVPKKEKRWLIYNVKSGVAQLNKSQLGEDEKLHVGFQEIEIEVEV